MNLPDPIREEFENWLMEVHGLDAEWQPERNCFREFPAHLAYQAWMASRENLVIELPEAHTAYRSDPHPHFFADEVKAAIESAGLKVAP